MKDKTHIILAFVGVLFGVMTLKTGGMSLFTEEGRVAAGSYVPFVLWFNFLAGFVYIAVGVGIFMRHSRALLMAKVLAIATFGVFILLLGHVATGGAYEVKTVVAMIFRGGIWAMIWFALTRIQKQLKLRPVE